MTNKENYKKLAQNTEKDTNSTELKDSSFFSEKAINKIYQKDSLNKSKDRIDRNKILDYIRLKAPITKYQISKDLNIAYTTISHICKEFQFCGLIKYKVVLGDNNRTHVLIILPDNNQIKLIEDTKND